MPKTRSQYCSGCRDDFYNDKNPLGIKRCANLTSARVVSRWRIGWWTQPSSRDAFRKVKTLTCHRAPGSYADYETIPAHLVQIKRRRSSDDSASRGKQQ